MSKLIPAICAFAVLGMASVVTPGFAAERPFAVFSGNWTGAGTVSVSNGTRERLRCKARYSISGEGSALSQDLTCASDSYKFNVVSHIAESGGTLSGSWTETSRNANGQISGHVDARQISAIVQGVGFSAGVAIASRGNKQVVEIRPTGTDITNVSVTMSKE